MATISDDFLSKVEQFAASVRQEVGLRQVSTLIKKTPGVCGGSACVRDTRIPVWTLIGLQKLGRGEADLLQDYPSLNAVDLDAVWSYYREHPSEIDAEIAAEERED
jgi:uncharacterized protein (DUF433 family)